MDMKDANKILPHLPFAENGSGLSKSINGDRINQKLKDKCSYYMATDIELTK